MEDTYLITIQTTQKANGETQKLDMTTHAALMGTTDDYTISYTDATGDLVGTRTQVHVENNRKITIIRAGEYQTNLILEPQVRHLTHYQTPYGPFMIGVCALHVNSQISETGGTLLFRYSTDVDMVPLGEIEFKMTLKPRSIGG